MPTIGVAVGLPEPHATFLQEARRATGDPLADRIRTHITLLPPTDVPGVGLAVIEEHLAVVASRQRRFVVVLDRVGTFRPVSPVQFLEVTQGAADCTALAEAVRSGPLARELGFPYHPHVTIAQQVSDEALDEVGNRLSNYRLRFEVGSFQLFEQGGDEAWRPVRAFPLASVGPAEPPNGLG